MKIDKPLFEKLSSVIDGESTVVIGLGNTNRADDGCGIKIVSELKARFAERAFFETERSAESVVLDCLERDDVRFVIFVDATDFSGSPGDVRLFDSEDAKAFVPPFSTHKVPITLLMALLQQKNIVPFLIGIQPESLVMFGDMSQTIQSVSETTANTLSALLSV